MGCWGGCRRRHSCIRFTGGGAVRTRSIGSVEIAPVGGTSVNRTREAGQPRAALLSGRSGQAFVYRAPLRRRGRSFARGDGRARGLRGRHSADLDRGARGRRGGAGADDGRRGPRWRHIGRRRRVSAPPPARAAPSESDATASWTESNACVIASFRSSSRRVAATRVSKRHQRLRRRGGARGAEVAVATSGDGRIRVVRLGHRAENWPPPPPRWRRLPWAQLWGGG